MCGVRTNIVTAVEIKDKDALAERMKKHGMKETEASIANKETDMTIGAALLVIVVGVLIAAFANSTIGIIVAVIGVIGLILALVSTSRSRSRL